MTSGNNPNSNTNSPVKPEMVAVNTTTCAMSQLDHWISADLESLVEKHADWQTTSSNRKYFGR